MNLAVFLKHLKEASSNLYGFIGYICVIAAWLYATIARHRLGVVAKIIKDLPEASRAEVIMREYRAMPRAGLSAEQWIRARLHNLLFFAFIATLITFLAIAGVALSRSSGEAEIPPLRRPVKLKNIGKPTPTIHSTSARSQTLPELFLKLGDEVVDPSMEISATHTGSLEQEASTEAAGKHDSEGLGLVQILEEGDNDKDNTRIFDVTLASKSKPSRLLTTFEVSWSYISGGGANVEKPYVLKPVGKYVIELPIDIHHPNDSSVQPLNYPVVVPSGSVNEPNLVSLRLIVYYKFTSQQHHPYTGWDIIFNVSILDDHGGRTVIFSQRRWKDRPPRRG